MDLIWGALAARRHSRDDSTPADAVLNTRLRNRPRTLTVEKLEVVRYDACTRESQMDTPHLDTHGTLPRANCLALLTLKKPTMSYARVVKNVVLIAGISLAACEPTTSTNVEPIAETAEPEVAAPEELGTHVVVSTRTPVYWAPKDDARLGVGSGDAWLTFELLGEQNGFLRLGLSAALDRQSHCYETHSARNKVDVSLWVKADAAEYVTPEPMTIEFGDGSSVELSAGVVIGTRGDQAMTHGLAYDVPLPSGIKTRRFTPSNVLKRSDETTLSVLGVRTGAGLVTSKSSFQVRELDTGVELSFRCGRVVGTADPNAKPRPHELKAPAIALLSAMERPHKIAAQTTVLWPDRTNAGAILVDSTVSVDRDDATCFKLQTGDVEHPIRLCVAESDLVAVKQPTGGLGSIPDMWGKSGLPLTKGQSRNPVVTNVRLKSLKQCEGEDCKDATKKERDLFGRMLRNRMAQYSYCFEAARRKNGSVSRKLDLGFKLDADGVTTNIVGPTDHTLGSCIQRRIRQMQRTVKKGNSFVGEAEFRFPERDR